jgi:ribulose-phosphate 3-epimerase
VNPGFGGQSFIPTSLDKIQNLSAMIRSMNLSTLIEVDGGITLDNAASVADAGTDILVAGSAVFAAGTIESSFKTLQHTIR